MIAISSAFWASAFLRCQNPDKSPTSDPQFDITQLSGQECLSPIGLQDEPFLTSELPVSNPESWSLIEPDAPTYASGGVIVLDADEDKDFDIISFSQSQPHHLLITAQDNLQKTTRACLSSQTDCTMAAQRLTMIMMGTMTCISAHLNQLMCSSNTPQTDL